MSSRDPRTWMWAEACELLERAERLHRQFFQLTVSPARGAMWEPPADIVETESRLWVLVALPGVPAERIEIHADADMVIITGDRPLPAEFRAATIHRLELPHGRFERRIELPPGRFDFESQEIANGCLVLTLRKR